MLVIPKQQRIDDGTGPATNLRLMPAPAVRGNRLVSPPQPHTPRPEPQAPEERQYEPSQRVEGLINADEELLAVVQQNISAGHGYSAIPSGSA